MYVDKALTLPIKISEEPRSVQLDKTFAFLGGMDDNTGDYIYNAYMLSAKGPSWTKVNLGLKSFKEHADNIVCATKERHNLVFASRPPYNDNVSCFQVDPSFFPKCV